MPQSRTRILICLTLVVLTSHFAAMGKKRADKAPDESGPSTLIEAWLVAGPAGHPLPAFAGEKPGQFDVAQALDADNLSAARRQPANGRTLSWFGGELAWSPVRVDDDGAVVLSGPADPERAGVAWLATYLETDRFRTLQLVVEGSHPRRAWLDGDSLVSGKTAKLESDMTLAPGKHRLLIKTVFDPEKEEAWKVSVRLTAEESKALEGIALSTEPRRALEIRDILDPPEITSLAVSPDGRKLVVSIRRIVPGSHDSESWIEMRRTEDGAVLDVWRGAVGARSVAWSPDGRYISYVTRGTAAKDEERSTLFVKDLETQVVRPLIENVDKLGSYLWSPSGEAIVYQTTVEAEKDERGVKLLDGLLDRWAGYRDKQFLNVVDVPGGSRRRLTAGALSTTARDVSHDGRKLLFTRQVEALDERPYTRSELWEIDLQSLATRKLRDFRWLNDAAYGPDGKRLLISGSADAFGEIGVNLSSPGVPNSYDGQLFVWDPVADAVEAITRSFDPAVSGAAWSRHDGKIYFVAEDRDFVRLYRYDSATSAIISIDTTLDTVRQPSIAGRAAAAVALGSSPWQPQTLVAIDLAAANSRRLPHPAGDRLGEIRAGRVEPWSFEASSGKTIDGRVYYPPGFDRERRYPVIVYYYGGTSPIGRQFGGRYPKELWAGNGYIVYVVQPSGATGFGQDFSAIHVNDWGKTTSEEILEGTRAFLEAHPFADPSRVGCIGASYGGFMTMLLTTKTDLFAAAVAHAGISALSSYWGEGYWGFLYSAVATAESFPWNRPDLYVEQSPLFRADRHQVPLLLTHGVADTNVPVGESDQFYIALKLLGKEVEYLQVEGQNHWIVDHAKRIVWNDSILAWFDRYLKDRPEWWSALHPDRGGDD